MNEDLKVTLNSGKTELVITQINNNGGIQYEGLH